MLTSQCLNDKDFISFLVYTLQEIGLRQPISHYVYVTSAPFLCLYDPVLNSTVFL